MTQTFGTNAANDIYLGPDGNIVVLRDLEAVLGACATAAKSQLGEMVLTIKAGIPNFQAIWVGVPNYALWESYLRRTLLNINGVQEVTDLRITRTGDLMQYFATIKTPFGIGELNG